jgi:glutathione S-transferase
MGSSLPILYSFRRCPYAMRARMAIWSSGIQVEIREVVLRDKPVSLITASPKATVPVLILPCGQVIDESIDIMRWALAQNDPDGWLERADLPLIAQNDGPFKAALDRYKYPHRYGLSDGLPYRNEGFSWLCILNDRLKNTPFLLGATCGLTDTALFPFVRQFRATDAGWFDDQAGSHLKNWLALLVETPMFAETMQKYPQWQESDPPTLFHQDQLFSH